ncbi:DapH/DapD/GlmU-related protein [Rhizobacter sp. Root404]|uniref:acyltransferase n=1 Tax=Rhizobacter sp. Root404 TaxID=1736528 RepID=UPI00138EE2A6|nr:acyltransferase [Rhizobacter sp. Root404]
MHRWLTTARWMLHAPRRRWRRVVRHGLLPFFHVHRQAEIEGDGRLDVAAGVCIGRSARLVVGDGHRLSLARGVWIGDDCELFAAPEVRIGSRTSLQSRSQILGQVSMGSGCVCAANLYVSSGSHRFFDEPHLPVRVQDRRAAARPSFANSRAVSIGDDCWIGINVVILPGVTIGRGCVVGANSVVRSDAPPYSVIGGAPASVLKTRLNFAPPSRIEAREDLHIPYFYSGFQQLGVSEDADDTCARERGGWVAGDRFCLALDVRPADVVDLEIDATHAGTIEHGARIFKVARGRNRLSIPAAPGHWNLLEFNWSYGGGDAAREGALVVLCAAVRTQRTTGTTP